jgi:uncharacterized protein (DUF58 family)
MKKYVINEEFLSRLDVIETVLKNNVAGMFGGNKQSKYGSFGSSCEFADYRDYMPGDDITKIDWNSYARFDRLYLKLFLDERQMHTRIYIDASRSMDYGNGRKAEQAVRLAAALAYVSVSEMNRVSVYTVKGDTVEEIIPLTVGKESFYNRIGNLNGIEFDGDSRISEAILPTAVGMGDGMSVIISDFLTDDDYETAIDHLVGKKRDVLCIQILSPEEINPQLIGKMHLFDSENLEKTYKKNIDRDILKAYKAAVAYATDRIRDYCLSRGASYLTVSSEDDVGEIFFGRLEEEGVVK